MEGQVGSLHGREEAVYEAVEEALTSLLQSCHLELAQLWVQGELEHWAWEVEVPQLAEEE
jgi:hypothetical protein